MLWFEYYFNLLRFFFPLNWCVELILPLCYCRGKWTVSWKPLDVSMLFLKVCKYVLIIAGVKGFLKCNVESRNWQYLPGKWKIIYYWKSQIAQPDLPFQRKTPSLEQPASFIHLEVHRSANIVQMPVKGTWKLFLCGCQIADEKIRNNWPLLPELMSPIKRVGKASSKLRNSYCYDLCWRREPRSSPNDIMTKAFCEAVPAGEWRGQQLHAGWRWSLTSHGVVRRALQRPLPQPVCGVQNWNVALMDFYNIHFN